MRDNAVGLGSEHDFTRHAIDSLVQQLGGDEPARFRVNQAVAFIHRHGLLLYRTEALVALPGVSEDMLTNAVALLQLDNREVNVVTGGIQFTRGG